MKGLEGDVSGWVLFFRCFLISWDCPAACLWLDIVHKGLLR
jgi:hypothetical protein